MLPITICVEESTALTASATHFTSISIQDPLDKEGTNRHFCTITSKKNDAFFHVGQLVTSN